MSEKGFTPALGRFGASRLYDPVLALTRERTWRGLLVDHAAVGEGEVVVDVGCGSGSLAMMLRERAPQARIVGVDPDEGMLAQARRKGAVGVEWRVGMGDSLVEELGDRAADVVVSSLVLHQCPMEMKQAILASMLGVLRPGGRLVIGDYGWQRTRLMRTAFRVVQIADGKRDTQPNADGVLPELMVEAGFQDVREAEVVPTISGSISVYLARREETGHE
ncbi:class I SAM-dependent methyltransferase [Actinocorallia longicatena]